MNYQIGIVGAGIIAVYSVLVMLIIILPLNRMLKRLHWRWWLVGPAALVLLAAPWAEEYWIARNFAIACEDTGVHVYKKVEVEGFYDATGGWGQQTFLQTPYKFVEFKSTFEHGHKRLEKADGSVRLLSMDQPTARYHYKYAYQPTPYKQEERIGWKLEKLGTVIVDTETGEIIARETDYRRTINIAEGSWRLYWGLAKTYCNAKPTEHLPNAALIPVTH